MNISKNIDLTYESTEYMFLVKESTRKTNGGGYSYDAALVTCSRFKEKDGGGKDQCRFESRGKNKCKCLNYGKKCHMRKDYKLNPKTNPEESNNSRANITEEENSYEYA